MRGRIDRPNLTPHHRLNLVLLRKELRQHGAIFLVLFLLNAAGSFLVGEAISVSGASGSVLAGTGFALTTLLAIAAATAAHRLVVLEYQKKTTLFLEALPLSRWGMLLTKLVFGWLFILGTATAVLLLGWAIAESEIRTGRFLTILLCRALLWASFLYAFFFLTSFLGRYRIPVYLFLGIALLWLASGSTLLRLGEFPPFALIDPNVFGFERDELPATNLLWTAGLVCALFGGSFVLGLAREGSVAAMLGERMSHREHLFFGGAFFVLISLPSLVEHHHPEPFRLPGAIEEEIHGIRISISPDQLGVAVDRELALAESLTKALAEEREWLKVSPPKWPPVFVVERTGLKSEAGGLPYEAGKLENDEGCLLYADYRAQGFPDAAFAHFVARQCLRVYSRDRIDREERRWVFDGFELVRELQGAAPAAKADWLSRAVQADREHPLSAADLDAWDRFEKSAGHEPARALSWHLLQTLLEQSDEDRFRSFIVAVLGPPVPARDVRAVVRDRFHPTRKLFARTIGMPLPDFLAVWKRHFPGNPPAPDSAPPAP